MEEQCRGLQKAAMELSQCWQTLLSHSYQNSKLFHVVNIVRITIIRLAEHSFLRLKFPIKNPDIANKNKIGWRSKLGIINSS